MYGRHPAAASSASSDNIDVAASGVVYTPEEVALAENWKETEPGLRHTSIGAILVILRKTGTTAPPIEEVTHSLEYQRTKLRKEMDRLVKAVAISRDNYRPDFQKVHRELQRFFKYKNIQDLYDNHPTEKMERIVDYLKETEREIRE